MAEPGLLDQDAIVVEQVRKLVEMRNQYGLYSTGGERLGSVEQVEQNVLHVLVRFFSDLDVALPTTLSLEDSQGRRVLRLHKPWFRWRMEVTRADGTPIGSIAKQVRLGKARFRIAAPDGSEIGEVHAQNWRARDFTVVDASGQQVANVTKKWRGALTEVLTDADTYVIELGASQEPLRSLALAAALSVDIIMKSKDS